MPSLRLIIPNGSGVPLAARLDVPEQLPEPLAYAIITHCFTCSKDYKAVYHLARSLVKQGLGVLRFDFSGLGESGGAFEETTFSGNVDDVLQVARYLTEHFQPPELLIGHSLGGTAAIVASGLIESIRMVCTVASPIDPGVLGTELQAARMMVRERGKATVAIRGRQFTISRSFFEDLDKIDLRNFLKGLKIPILVFHSVVDEIVPYSQAREMLEAAGTRGSLLTLEQADHLLSQENDARFAGQLIGLWYRHLSGMES